MIDFIGIVMGVILLLITIFIHKHTYWYKSRHAIPSEKDKVRCPMWAAILICIGALIPGFNLMLFVFGFFWYLGQLVGAFDDSIVFYWDSPKWQGLIRFLTKKV